MKTRCHQTKCQNNRINSQKQQTGIVKTSPTSYRELLSEKLFVVTTCGNQRYFQRVRTARTVFVINLCIDTTQNLLGPVPSTPVGTVDWLDRQKCRSR